MYSLNIKISNQYMHQVNFIMKLLLVTLTFSISQGSMAQSKAHNRSKFAKIDPTYSTHGLQPKSEYTNSSICWIYGPSEEECWRLQLLQQRKDSAKLNVGYPGIFYEPKKGGMFRLKLNESKKLNQIRFRAVGHGNVYINKTLIGKFSESPSLHTLKFNKDIKVEEIRFDIATTNDLPTLLVKTKSIATTSGNAWEWATPESSWVEVSFFPQNLKKIAPHRMEDPLKILRPVSVKNNLYDFGRELFGYLLIKSKEKPVFNVGESKAEGLDIENKSKEQSLELTEISEGIWQTKVPLAFRYVFSPNTEISIWSESIFHPVIYKGAFACSDSMLTKIWMYGAYTLHLCMHDFLLDGIKRDRLPWAGDLAMDLLVDAYSFSDNELVRRSLVALGRAGIKEKDINGIVDYSLWWIISQDQYQLYYADKQYLKQEWPNIKETLNYLSSLCDSTGFLVPRKDTWLFIDWVKQEKWTALQVLWWWAQNSGAKLAERVGDVDAARYWNNRTKSLKVELMQSVYDFNKKIWLSKKNLGSEKSRYPNFLAIVSGLATPDQYEGIRRLLEDEKVESVGSPYMAGFEMMALSQLGNTNYILNHVKDYWGGMINRGATTFWEAFDKNDSTNKQYSYYGRPYAKSLCHAWSAGPTAFLPYSLFGLKPLEDGWRLFTLNPNIGYLKWANVCLPTKYGNIIVDINEDKIQISIPKGASLEWKGNTYVGPRLLKENL